MLSYPRPPCRRRGMVGAGVPALVPDPRPARRHWGRIRSGRNRRPRRCRGRRLAAVAAGGRPGGIARAGLGEVAVVGGPADRLIRFLEFLAGDAAVGVERVPDFGREGAAEDGDPVDAGHRDVVRFRVADPDRGCQVGLVAGEPGVGVFVGGPGLAGLAGAAGVGGGAGPFGDVVVEQFRHLVGDGFGQHPLRVRRLRPVDLAAGKGHLLDRDRIVVDATGGEGRVGIGQLQRGDAEAQAADPLGRDPVQRRRDPHRLRRLGNALGTDVEVELGEDGVVGGDGRLLQVDRALVALVGGVDGPAAPLRQVEVERFRRVVGRVGVDPLLDRGGENEGLEGRARLAAALGGEVELRFRVVGAGDHGPDVAVARVDRDQRRGGVGRVGEGRSHRFQADFLQVRVDRRLHLQPAAAHGVDPVLADQVVLDVVEEVGLAVIEVGVGDVEVETRAGRRRGPLVGDVAELGHLAQHLVAAFAGGRRVEDRVVFGGRLRQPGQQRRLRQGQLPDRLVEVDPRGRLHADRGAALDRPVGGDVEVGAEDFLARVPLRVLRRQLRLDDLAFEVLLRVGDAEVADQLLGDRRAALDRLAGFEVLQRGAGDALVVEAAVLVEALVLDRHRRQLQAPGDALDRDRRARFVGGDDPELAAVGRVEGGITAPVDRLAGGERGRVGGDVEDPGGDADHRDHGEREDAAADQQQLASDPTAASLASPVALRHRSRA